MEAHSLCDGNRQLHVVSGAGVGEEAAHGDCLGERREDRQAAKEESGQGVSSTLNLHPEYSGGLRTPSTSETQHNVLINKPRFLSM